jgi:hypothetical protein
MYLFCYVFLTPKKIGNSWRLGLPFKYGMRLWWITLMRLVGVIRWSERFNEKYTNEQRIYMKEVEYLIGDKIWHYQEFANEWASEWSKIITPLHSTEDRSYYSRIYSPNIRYIIVGFVTDHPPYICIIFWSDGNETIWPVALVSILT